MKLVLVAVAVLSSCVAIDSDRPAATPQRPTLSSDTNTTAGGTVELEAGVAVDPGTAHSTPLLVKWGSSERTELAVGWSPLVHAEPGFDGPSDVTLGVRHRVVDETADHPAVAWLLSTKLPTANGEIGTGEIDVFGGGIVTKQFGDFSTTAYYQLGVLGDPSGRGTDLGHDLAIAGGIPLDDRWGAFAELAGSLVPDRGQHVWFTTLGVTLAAQRGSILDLSVALGLSNDAPDAVLQFGVTHNLGPVFRWFE